MNLVEYLARATEYLDKHDISSPRLNSELLLAAMLDTTRLEIYTKFERELSEREAAEYRDLVMKRASGVPLQYITGETGFRGLTLEMREGVFIPRPETEVLVEKALEKAQDAPPGDNALRVLDLGTGCGNVAVSIAAECEVATVVATDCDPDAVALCEANAERARVAERVRTAVGDLYGCLDPDSMFDLIVSNPPYIPESMRSSLPAEVRDFEPERALFAGPRGLDTITRIVEGAGAHLSAGGWLVLEVDESHAPDVANLFETESWSQVEVFDDLAGRPRIVRARHGEPEC